MRVVRAHCIHCGMAGYTSVCRRTSWGPARCRVLVPWIVAGITLLSLLPELIGFGCCWSDPVGWKLVPLLLALDVHPGSKHFLNDVRPCRSRTGQLNSDGFPVKIVLSEQSMQVVIVGVFFWRSALGI